MNRYLLKIAYDGSNYHGWQVQPNGITVQEVLQNSLKTMLGAAPDVTGCSRTDAGVHAREFYCHIDTGVDLPENAFIKGLNSVLPEDIKVISYKQIKPDFHARYNCKGKRYVYNFYIGNPDPFLERYYLRLEKMPDIEKMNEFCKTIIGKHDFCGFSSSKRTVEDTVRTVKDCFITQKSNKIHLKITADGFLYNMVRIISGTALAVGYGKLSPDIADEIFNEKSRDIAGKTLPAKGLFLDKVFY